MVGMQISLLVLWHFSLATSRCFLCWLSLTSAWYWPLKGNGRCWHWPCGKPEHPGETRATFCWSRRGQCCWLRNHQLTSIWPCGLFYGERWYQQLQLLVRQKSTMRCRRSHHICVSPTVGFGSSYLGIKVTHDQEHIFIWKLPAVIPHTTHLFTFPPPHLSVCSICVWCWVCTAWTWTDQSVTEGYPFWQVVNLFFSDTPHLCLYLEIYHMWLNLLRD